MKLLLFFIPLVLCFCCQNETKKSEKKVASQSEPIAFDTINTIPIVSYETRSDKIQFFLKNEQGHYFNNHGNLKNHLEKKDLELKFAMNGGMYLQDSSPQGLYIENGKTIKKLNTKKSTYGNFYLQPNGVFHITNNGIAHINTSKSFKQSPEIKYATQSGPMLLIKGKMHPVFTKGSKHIHIRNGVGILPNGNLLFAMSKDSINFYDFASYFKKKGCKNALYLDGAISKIYLPSKDIKQVKGKFGVIIAETKKK